LRLALAPISEDHVSNPDFPGSSWQDGSEFAREPQGWYPSGRDGGYAGRPAAERGTGYPGEADYPAGREAGRRSRRGDRARGARGARGQRPDDWHQAPTGDRGDYGDGSGGYGDYAATGAADRRYGGDHGRPGRGHRRAGGNGAGGNGYAGPEYGGNGSGRDGRGGDGRGGAGSGLLPGGQPGTVSDDIGRGHAKGYRGGKGRRRAGRGTRQYGPGRTGGAGGLAELADPDGSGDPGQPGGRGRGGGGGGGRPAGLVRPPRSVPQRLLHGRWWRHWSVKKVLLLAGAMAAALVLVLAGGFVVIYNHYQVPLAGIASAQQQSSVVYFSDGHSMVGTFGQVNRTVLTKFPPLLEEAFFAAEDRNFRHEGGISLTGTARALFVDLTGGNLQGGSTITEQLVKNYYEAPGAPRTLSTKLAEIVVAIKLAKLESKDWILAHYLNTIFLGPKYMPGGAYGVQAAAEAYFGVPASKLTLSQDAMIAALPKAPSLYDARPATGYWHDRLVQRWRYVIDNMARDNAITQQQADAARFPAVVKPRTNDLTGYDGYVMSLVYNELRADGYSDKTIYDGGLRVYTSISKRLMKGLYRAVRQNKALMRSQGRPMPSYVHVGAVLEQPGTGQILAFYGGPGYGVRHCRKLRCQLDTILAPEPVGSSFKPYVLATAVSQGMDVQTSVLNSHSPLCIPPDWTLALQLQQSKQTMKCNTPKGYWLFNESAENYRQNLSVSDATAFSNDPAFEDLIHRTGVQNVINMAARLGVSSYDVTGLNALFGDHCLKHHRNCHPGSVVAALGAGSLTAVDQANTFATLVSGGWSVTPHVIKYIDQGTGKTPARITKVRALTPAEAADADYALSFDTTLPGATGLNATWNRPVIAKTGTLGTGANSSQAWFIGAIPQYSLSVGMFTDRPQANPPQILDGLPPVGAWPGSYGGAWPASIWHTFMTDMFNNLPVKQLPAPDFSSPPFFRWVQAPAVKPRPKPPPQQHCPPGQMKHGRGPCPSPTPTPSATPTSTPSATPTPTSKPTKGPPGVPPRRSGPRHPAGPSGGAALTVVVSPPGPLLRRPGWVVTTGLI